jgi:hypothetical protein
MFTCDVCEQLDRLRDNASNDLEKSRKAITGT